MPYILSVCKVTQNIDILQLFTQYFFFSLPIFLAVGIGLQRRSATFLRNTNIYLLSDAPYI